MTGKITILVDVPAARAYYRDIITGVARFCRQDGDVRLRFATDEWEYVGNTLPIHGVICVISDDDSRKHSEKFGTPVVNISSRAKVDGVPSVVSDNEAIGAMAAEHLLAEGYTSFAGHMTSHVQFSIDRTKGFADRVRAAGHSFEVFDTANTSVQFDKTDAVIAQMIGWLRRLPKPVGLFTHNDTRGVMLLDLCREAKLNVPGDIGIISVDNDEFLDLLPEPTLSSVNPNAAMVGFKAAEALAATIRGTSPPPLRLMIKPSHVVQRESTQLIFERDAELAQAVRFIRKHAVPSLTIGEVLAEVALSRRVLERRFRERLGRSPADEILRVRMEWAKTLLATTNQPLKQVAAAVGYKEYPNFAIAFRREVGSSPSEFRTVHLSPERRYS